MGGMQASHPSLLQQSAMSISNSFYKFQANTPIGCPECVVYSITHKDTESKLTFADFFHEVMREESTLLRQFVDKIHSFSYEQALFFETPPINYNSYQNTPFEYILIPSKRLSVIEPEYTPFEAKFQLSCSGPPSSSSSSSAAAAVATNIGEVVSFGNLAGDSMLVVPCPFYNMHSRTALNFSHLYSFVRTAPSSLVERFFKRVALEAIAFITDKPTQSLWISTSGLGVSWLHMRLDSFPKYYNWAPYKKPLD